MLKICRNYGCFSIVVMLGNYGVAMHFVSARQSGYMNEQLFLSNSFDKNTVLLRAWNHGVSFYQVTL
jgi:hypothetical protein